MRTVGKVKVRQERDTPLSLVEWTPPRGQQSRAVTEEEGGDQLTTEWRDGTGEPIELAMLGLAASTAYRAWVELEDGATSDAIEFVTDPVPAEFPDWTISGDPGWRGWMLTEVMGSGRRAVLLDAKGRTAWYSERFPSSDPTIRAALRQEGDGIWVLTESSGAGLARLRAYGWDSVEIASYTVGRWTHDFVVMSTGEFLWLEDDCRRVGNGETACGERVMRGTVDDLDAAVELWSVFDDFDPQVDGIVRPDGDWTHANAIDVDEAAGRISVGLRGLSAILQLDLDTGAVLRQIGGPHSDFVPADADSTLDGQHQFDFLSADTAIIYDNRATEDVSRVVTMEFDDDAGTMTAVGVINPDPELWGYFLGDVDRFGSGTLVTWSSAGIIAKYDPDGVEDWSLASNLGVAFGYTTRITALPGMAAVE